MGSTRLIGLANCVGADEVVPFLSYTFESDKVLLGVELHFQLES